MQNIVFGLEQIVVSLVRTTKRPASESRLSRPWKILECGSKLNPLTANLCSWNFNLLKLRIADAIHNFKWLKIIWFEQTESYNVQILLIDVMIYI